MTLRNTITKRFAWLEDQKGAVQVQCSDTHLPIFRVVHSDGGVALGGAVDVSVVPYGSDSLHGMARHAGHGDR